MESFYSTVLIDLVLMNQGRIIMKLSKIFYLLTISLFSIMAFALTQRVGLYSGPAVLKQEIEQNRAMALALASADFDEDGVADLIAGYKSPDGKGIVALHRGNVDSLYPNSREAQERRQAGIFTDTPFLSPVIIESPISPEFISAGDFDADSHMDLAVAARGAVEIWLMSGDGGGGFEQARRILLPGQVTAMVAGEINRADGLADLALGIVGFEGPKLLVFEGPAGALRAVPETFNLPSRAVALAPGQLDEDYPLDLAVAAGNELLIIHGRDRKLSLDEAGRADVAEAIITRRSFSLPIVSLAAGDFVRGSRTDLGVLLQGGRLEILEPAEKMRRGEKSKTNWRASRSMDTSPSAHLLVSARVSGRAGDDLLLFDPESRQLQILTDDKTEVSGRFHVLSAVTSLDMESEPVAVLPMRLNESALKGLVILKEGHSTPLVSAIKPLATFTVTNTADSGAGSLRQAILDANASAGMDTITFSIGSGVQTISPASALPDITDPVIIDGTTQSGFSNTPIIELSGANAGINVSGLKITAGSSTVRGLVINRFIGKGITLVTNGGNVIEGNFIGVDPGGTTNLGNSSDGVEISGVSNNTVGGTTTAARNLLSGNSAGVRMTGSATENLVQGNFLGTDINGTVAIPNRAGVGGGVVIRVGPSNNTVGGAAAGARNLLSGNEAGVRIIAGSNNIVQGNYIGTDASGTKKLSNDSHGVEMSSASSNNTIGGTSAGARNIISGNDNAQAGITISSSNGNVVQGNYIGTDVTGNLKLENFLGVSVGGNNNLIGGTQTGASNVISGNSLFGIRLLGGSANIVQGNYIGTNAAGTARLANGVAGININSSGGNTIGGITSEARNIISGNGTGISITNFSVNNLVQGNFIGTNAAGTAAIGNTTGILIIPQVASSTTINNTIGGTTAGAGNRIAFNNGPGVTVISGSGSAVGNAILANEIFSNTGQGIDLGNDGITANDTGDGDSGANNLQNFPILTTAAFTGSNTIVKGTLNSTANTTFTIEVFVNTACDDAGNREGETFFGRTMFTSDANGDAKFTITGTAASLGQFVVATATDSSNNTSEFSACIEVVAPPIITEFSPASGFVGTSVIITGANLPNATSVEFNSVGATITSNSDTQIIAVVPSGASTGKISVTNANGTAISENNFIVLPKIDNFTPTSAFVGTEVTITGSGFIGATAVAFGDISATFNVVSANTITATLPSAARIGKISVTTADGTAMSASNFIVLAKIDGFTPTGGTVGTTVTITGSGFLDATKVEFNGTSTSFDLLSANSISVVVPNGATTGKISVTTEGNIAVSGDDFKVFPKIDDFTPTNGTVGMEVTITGSAFTGATAVTFNGTSATFSDVTYSSIKAVVPVGATTGKITVTTPSGSDESDNAFGIGIGIGSFNPASGPVGTSITITGSGFTGATAVTFNTVRATIFKVVSNNMITATVPTGATTGPIKVTTPLGTFTSGSNFKVSPKVNSFTPTSGKAEAAVTIAGLNFTGATAVSFNGVNATTFTVVSATSIKTNVPLGAKTGPISVTTPDGTGTSATNFTVLSGISSFTPPSGPVGTTVTINGSGFTTATAVKFGAVNASFTVDSDNKITTVVPAGAVTGRITVTATTVFASTTNFGVSPRIDNFTPGNGAAGTVVMISGFNFSGATSVKFGGASGTFTILSATSIRATVPATAVGGPITVTTAAGTGTSANSFLVLPRVTSFTPAVGPVGTAVTITGSGFASATDVKFGNVSAGPPIVTSATMIKTTVPPGASTGAITVTTEEGDATSAAVFKVSPKITGFSPTSALPGESIMILGSNFTGATSVKFGTLSASPTDITIDSDTQITVKVPLTAITGKISVTTANGTGISGTDFIVIKSPAVTSFTPANAPIGAQVTITGTNLSSVTEVKFNGISAGAPQIISATSIKITVPMQATTGKISVTNRAGTAMSAAIFKVSPRIDGFGPDNVIASESVTITGLNLKVGSTNPTVRIGSVTAPVTTATENEVVITVPATALTGKISVTTVDGAAMSANSLTVIRKPTISSFTPASGKVGATVTISGTNLPTVTEVKFGNTTITDPIVVVSATSIRVKVPAGATTGKITVTNRAGNATSVGSFTVLP
jgi:hypothetical protein